MTLTHGSERLRRGRTATALYGKVTDGVPTASHLLAIFPLVPLAEFYPPPLRWS